MMKKLNSSPITAIPVYLILSFILVCSSCSSCNGTKTITKKGAFVSSVDSVTGTWEKSDPPNLIITATGSYPESCWGNARLAKREGGKYGPNIYELNLVGDRLTDVICHEAITHFSAVFYTIERVDQATFEKVIVYSNTNSVTYPK